MYTFGDLRHPTSRCRCTSGPGSLKVLMVLNLTTDNNQKLERWTASHAELTFV